MSFCNFAPENIRREQTMKISNVIKRVFGTESKNNTISLDNIVRCVKKQGIAVKVDSRRGFCKFRRELDYTVQVDSEDRNMVMLYTDAICEVTPNNELWLLRAMTALNSKYVMSKFEILGDSVVLGMEFCLFDKDNAEEMMMRCFETCEEAHAEFQGMLKTIENKFKRKRVIGFC